MLPIIRLLIWLPRTRLGHVETVRRLLELLHAVAQVGAGHIVVDDEACLAHGCRSSLTLGAVTQVAAEQMVQADEARPEDSRRRSFACCCAGGCRADLRGREQIAVAGKEIPGGSQNWMRGVGLSRFCPSARSRSGHSSNIIKPNGSPGVVERRT